MQQTVGMVPKHRESPPRTARLVMKPLTRLMNPLVSLLAGRRHFAMVGLLTHRGRSSGRIYRTPVGARIVGDSIWIPLSFGTGSDWCRNVLAAGGCEIQLKGICYAGQRPRIVEREGAAAVIAAYPLMQRLTLRLIRLDAFLSLDAVQADIASNGERNS